MAKFQSIGTMGNSILFEKCSRYHYRAVFQDGRAYNMVQDGAGLWALYLSHRVGSLGLLRRSGYPTLAGLRALLIDVAENKVIL